MDYAQLLQSLGELSCGLVSGGALYITFVQHPALSETLKSTEDYLGHFPSFCSRATRLQRSLAALSSVSFLASFFLDPVRPWRKLVAGLLMGSILPYTLTIVNPITNQFLKAVPAAPPSKPYPTLFATWGKLHWGRTVAALLAFCLSVWK